jgi:thymidylate synthase (FAD)
MEIIEPSYRIVTKLNYIEILESLEAAGRVAYKSEDKITEGSAEKFIASIIARGHESVLEHEWMSVLFINDRGITHEEVRHRIASFTQESTRYCDYYKKGIRFIQPPWIKDLEEQQEYADDLLIIQNLYYKWLNKWGEPQKARYWLINGTKSEIRITANFREWRHILKQRTSKAAHPQMRQLMIPLLKELQEKLPVLFNDIKVVE